MFPMRLRSQLSNFRFQTNTYPQTVKSFLCSTPTKIRPADLIWSKISSTRPVFDADRAKWLAVGRCQNRKVACDANSDCKRFSFGWKIISILTAFKTSTIVKTIIKTRMYRMWSRCVLYWILDIEYGEHSCGFLLFYILLCVLASEHLMHWTAFEHKFKLTITHARACTEIVLYWESAFYGIFLVAMLPIGKWGWRWRWKWNEFLHWLCGNCEFKRAKIK